MGIPRLFGIRHGKRMSTHWSLAQWKKLIGMVIWIGVNSSQRFLKSPCDCASSCRVCVSPGWSSAGFGSWLCAACTPVDGMNRRGAQEGWGEEEERKKTERGGVSLQCLQTDWRQRQNRGHAWSTTQNKPGQTRNVAAAPSDSDTAAFYSAFIQLCVKKEAVNLTLTFQMGSCLCYGEGKLRLEPSHIATPVWQLLRKGTAASEVSANFRLLQDRSHGLITLWWIQSVLESGLI